MQKDASKTNGNGVFFMCQKIYSTKVQALSGWVELTIPCKHMKFY